MDSWLQLAIDLALILVLIAGVAQFRDRKRARSGNFTAALALMSALGILLYRYPVLEPAVVFGALVAGAAVAGLVAVRVRMIHMPALVAFQNGAGGLAASIVSLVEMERAGLDPAVVNVGVGILGLVLGAVTFAGSMTAAGKLSGFLRQRPTVMPGHAVVLAGTVLATFALGALAAVGISVPAWLPAVMIAPALLAGVAIAVRVGGADMPVLISFFNAGTGLAAAFCGVVVQNSFLIACGAMVGASGTILTHAMCRAMNRSIVKVLAGGDVIPAARMPGFDESAGAAGEPRRREDDRRSLRAALSAVRDAGSVIIVPGYGMALAQAQADVVKLADRLEKLGKTVSFAIHPVAGRMPGHMNVLLAEAGADYEKLKQMDEINPIFKETDLALVVGACDVVNPAAIHVEDTPISGMPILLAYEAAHVVICNLDESPGYSGVDNPLYTASNAILLWGDAKASIGQLLESLGISDSR